MKITGPLYVNPIRPEGKEGGGRAKVPALISTFQNFLAICIIYLSFLQSETSLNFSNFDRQDFVKIQNFDYYGVMMTSFTNEITPI